MIAIGLETGRPGTVSLAKLLNAQHGELCSREMNPSSVRGFSGAPRPMLNTIDEYQVILDGDDSSMLTADFGQPVAFRTYDELCKLRRVRLIGEFAFYYLTHVEGIAARNPNVRFLWLRRDMDQTVASWMNKSCIPRWRSKYMAHQIGAWITREHFHESRDFWMEHAGSRWQLDSVWDICFPKFEAASKPEAIRRYCEFYYAEAERLAPRLKNVFRFVETKAMQNRDYQAGILTFASIPADEQVFTDAHIYQSPPGKAARAPRRGGLTKQARG